MKKYASPSQLLPISVSLLICFFLHISLTLWLWSLHSSFNCSPLTCCLCYLICPLIPQDPHVSWAPQKHNATSLHISCTVIIFITKFWWFFYAPVLMLAAVDTESLLINDFLILPPPLPCSSYKFLSPLAYSCTCITATIWTGAWHRLLLSPVTSKNRLFTLWKISKTIQSNVTDHVICSTLSHVIVDVSKVLKLVWCCKPSRVLFPAFEMS